MPKIYKKSHKLVDTLYFLLVDVLLKRFFYLFKNFFKIHGLKKYSFPIYMLVGISLWFALCNKEEIHITNHKSGYEAAIHNYKDDVEKAAKEFDLPASYLMALIILECSGKKDIKPRFEKSIYKKLKQLKNKEITKFENLTYSTVKNADDDALRNLASSWGPFQLMGYKCTFLDIKLKEMRGEKAIYYGAKWINITYGDYLRAAKYKDAFHIHNTGEEYPSDDNPKTYDPDYVTKGLEYMEYFQNNYSIN